MPYFIFFLLSSGWVCFLLFMAYIKNSSILYQFVFYIIGITCHQAPEKSFYFMNNQIPVCGRCFGIYAGLVAGLLIYPIFKNIKNTSTPSIKLLPVFILPVLIDGAFNLLETNIERMLTGLIFGIGVVFYLLPLINDMFYSKR